MRVIVLWPHAQIDIRLHRRNHQRHGAKADQHHMPWQAQPLDQVRCAAVVRRLARGSDERSLMTRIRHCDRKPAVYPRSLGPPHADGLHTP